MHLVTFQISMIGDKKGGLLLLLELFFAPKTPDFDSFSTDLYEIDSKVVQKCLEKYPKLVGIAIGAISKKKTYKYEDFHGFSWIFNDF